MVPRMSEQDGRERRQHSRTPLFLKVEYASKEGFLDDYTTNISAGGMRLCSNVLTQVGETIDVSIYFPGLLARIALRAEVRWVRSAENDEGYEAGVEFVDRDSSTWPRLQQLVQRIDAGDEAVVAKVIVRVLVVEDNPHMAQMIHRGLEGYPRRGQGEGVAYQITHASSGSEAWDFLQDGQFDLLITDVLLPGIDGEALVRKVRGEPRWSDLPIIAVSAAGGEVGSKMLAAGTDFFLSKPIRLNDLVQTMRRLTIATRGDQG